MQQPQIVSSSNTSSNILRDVNVVAMTMIALLPVARLFRAVRDILASLWADLA